MATITVSDSGGTREWTNPLTWVGGSVPLATDNVIFTVTSDNLIINTVSTIVDFNLSNFTGTITFTSALFINGNWNLGSGTYTQLGTSFIRKQGIGTITSNGVIWSKEVRFFGNGITTLTDDFNLSGKLEFQESSGNMIVNGSNIYHTGTIGVSNNGGIISGSTKYWYQGTGVTWAQGISGCQINIDFYINTTGTFTMSGSSTNGILFGGNKELKVISGTLVTTGLSALTLWGRTIDFNGNTIHNLRLINSNQTVTLLSPTPVTTLTINQSLSITQTITGFEINTNHLSITGIGTSTSITQGDTVINFVGSGTGTWSQVGSGAIRNNININKTGTLNITGTVYYNTGILTYIQGTVNTTGSTFICSGAATINSNGDPTSASTISSTGINFNNFSTQFTVLGGLVTNATPIRIIGTLTHLYNCTGAVYVNGSLVVINNSVGTGTSITLNGTGSWTGASTVRNVNLIIDTLGTITANTNVSISDATITYVKGTVNTGIGAPGGGGTLTVTTACTFNTTSIAGTISWNNVIISTGIQTINSLLTIAGTLTIGSGGNITFSGTSGFTAANVSCTTAGRTITLTSGITYNVTSNLNLVGSTASRIIIRSLTTPRAIFTLPYGATQNVKNTSATNIDSSLGQIILSSAGVLTNTLNWSIGSGNFFLMF